MDTRSAYDTANNAPTMDESDKTAKGSATMDDTTNFGPSIGASPHQDDRFSENSSSKRVKVDAGSAIVTKSAVASMIQDQNSPLAEANLRVSSVQSLLYRFLILLPGCIIQPGRF
jgi:hypothetical protein